LERFAALHPDGRRLVDEWYRRAEAGLAAGQQDSFEPFIYLWIAFNAWSACVTREERDTAWRDALISDRSICATFDELVADEQSPLSHAATHFRDLWPIYKVEELRRLGVDYWTGADLRRAERGAEYRAAGVEQFEPRCWADHLECNESPLDWPHTLAALYRVRCNLFHGEKARSSVNDQQVVHAAYTTLLSFIRHAGYLG
jgi:hypothetical protein